MVADKVRVRSRPATEGVEGTEWASDGSGQYTITSCPEAEQGCQIYLHLKDECASYSDPLTVKEIIKKYSNFVSFPVKVNGEVANSVGLWLSGSIFFTI